jgi:predicted transcriptional regulator
MYQKFEQMRQQRGLTIYAVAKKSGIPQSTMYEWLKRCKTDPDAHLSAQHAASVARVLGVDVAWLIE